MTENKCAKCGGKGYIIVPNNQEEYDRIFDTLFDTGTFSAYDSEQKALKRVGSHREDCPDCKKD